MIKTENPPLFELVQIRRNGIVVEFGIAGAGPAVVMLPGRGGAGTEQFGALGQALATAGYRAVAVNPRGVGGSRGPLEELTLHDLAGDVAAVIASVGGTAHLVGRALGNRIARCAAADHPQVVRSVSLIAAGGLSAPEPGAAGHGSRTRLDITLHYWRRAGDAHEHAATATPLDEWWSGGDVPMLVVQGLDDHVAVPGNGRALAQAYPDRVRLVEIAGAGHMVLYERPDAVIPEIVSFIDGLERAESRAC